MITTEAEFIAAPIGTVLRDRNKDIWVKVHERGAQQDNIVGLWGPTWIAYPAEVLVPETPAPRVPVAVSGRGLPLANPTPAGTPKPQPARVLVEHATQGSDT